MQQFKLPTPPCSGSSWFSLTTCLSWELGWERSPDAISAEQNPCLDASQQNLL